MKNTQPKTHGSNCAVKEVLGCAVVFDDFDILISDPAARVRAKQPPAVYDAILNDIFPAPYCTKAKLVNQFALDGVVRNEIYGNEGSLNSEMVTKIVQAFTQNKKTKQPMDWLKTAFKIPKLPDIPGTIRIKGVCQGNTDIFTYTETTYSVIGGGDKNPHDTLSNTCMRAWFNTAHNNYPALIIAPSRDSFGNIQDSNGQSLNRYMEVFNPEIKENWLNVDPKSTIGNVDLVTLYFNGAIGKEKIPGKTGNKDTGETNPGKADLLPAALVLDTVVKLHAYEVNHEQIKQYVATCFAINIFANVYHWAPYNASISDNIGYLPADNVQNDTPVDNYLLNDYLASWIGPNGEQMG